MKSILFCLFSLTITICPHRCYAANQGNETDRQALVAFKAGISNDPFGFLKSWNESIHFCQWSGVTCNRRQQRVIVLSTAHQKLMGSVSPYIGNMSFLRTLSLQNNTFTRHIPPQLGRLPLLQILHLNNNSFSGIIPASLSACSNLEQIFLAYNELRGEIPAQLGSLMKLKQLRIDNNNFTGAIPLSFGNLSSLVVLQATSNSLSGTIPSVLGQLVNLESMLLSANNFSGVIPSAIFNLSSLVNFAVARNQLHGSLPLNIGITLPYLVYLNIDRNSFTGSIPPSISNMSNLEVFSAIGNQLTGKMPSFYNLQKLDMLTVDLNQLGSGQPDGLTFISSLSNASHLTFLSLSYNSFGGRLPESIGNLSTKLQALNLGANQISGSLPSGIGNLVNLEWLILSQNHFTGNIPHSIWKLQNLHKLDLGGGNKFSGKLSPFVGNLSLLLQLLVDGNDLQGAIPSSVGSCKGLMQLDLSKNNFSGTIPREIFDLSLLSVGLDLSDNRLTGRLPSEVGNLKNLGALDISTNMLSGEIPSSLGRCSSMEYLYMGGNFFQGNIPLSLSSLRGIQLLDLSPNNLSGQIPNFLGRLDLKLLNLSFNNFEGAVPSEGIFKNSTAFSVEGNTKLCGGTPEMKLPICTTQRSKQKRSTLTLKLIIPMAVGLLALTSALGILVFCWLRKNRKVPPSSSPGYSSLMRISFQSLVNATEGFASANLIGMGSFGSVYRGVLEDGKAIAVKVLNLHRRGALKSFMAECEALRNIRHRNLVMVLSACSGIDYQGNDFKAVVYELMVKGSLEEWLHPVSSQIDATQRQFLTILQRLNIAIDTASALDYLHHRCQKAIVHCDIKPSNVLLDNDMIAHVGDFGLARLILEEIDNLTPNQSSSLAVKGTVGYAPPEYGMGSEVSIYGDLYSYGILVLEMFTGKRPTDDIFHGGLNLHNFAKLAFSEGLIGIVDPVLLKLGEDGDKSENASRESEKVEEILVSVLKIGVACSNESAGERMDITSALAELQAIRNSFLTTAGSHIN